MVASPEPIFDTSNKKKSMIVDQNPDQTLKGSAVAPFDQEVMNAEMMNSNSSEAALRISLNVQL